MNYIQNYSDAFLKILKITKESTHEHCIILSRYFTRSLYKAYLQLMKYIFKYFTYFHYNLMYVIICISYIFTCTHSSTWARFVPGLLAQETKTLVTRLYLLTDSNVYGESLYVVCANRTYWIELDSLRAQSSNQWVVLHHPPFAAICWIFKNSDTFC